jgi:hypothetical protein
LANRTVAAGIFGVKENREGGAGHR